MSFIKRALGTIGVATLAIGLAACASTEPAAEETVEETASTGTLGGESFVVAVSDDEVPFGYVDDTNEFVGVTADLLEALSAELGFDYTIEATDFAAAIPGVQSGKYDFAFRQMGITAERIDILDMVSWKQDGVLLQKLPESDIEIGDNFEGICGLNVGILNGEAQSEAKLTELSEACVANGEAEIAISAFADRATADLAIKSERIDLSTNSVGMFSSENFVSTGPVFNQVYQGIGLPLDSELAPVLAEGMNALIADGTYAAILEEYGVAAIAVDESLIDPLYSA